MRDWRNCGGGKNWAAGRELQQRVDALSAQSFENKQYRPQLLKHAAPEFELTTLQGEKFDNAHLRGKKII